MGRFWTVRMRMLTLAAVPLAFLLVLLGLALFLQTRSAQVAQQSQRLAGILFEADRAGEIVDGAGQGVVVYARTRNEAALKPLADAKTALPAALATVASLSSSYPENSKRLARLSAALYAGMNLLDEFVGYFRAKDPRAAALLRSPRVRRVNVEIEEATEGFNNGQRTIAEERLKEIGAQISLYTWILVGLVALAIVVTIAVATRLGIDIARRIARLGDNARRLAGGEAAEPIEGSDEIAQLDLVYQAMMRQAQREHNRVMILQRALLPQALPVLPGIRLDAAYQPASGGSEIGGDWYDVFSISDRCIGISAGDVAGHGLRSATTMGGVRQAIRTAAYIDPDPATVFKHVNRLLCRNESDALITAFYATLDRTTGVLRYSLAGHPPPLIAKTVGTVEPLPGSGFVLGVDARAEYASNEYQLDIGCAVVVFTDGVVETERDYLAGVDELVDAVENEYRDASHNIAQAILARTFANRLPRDDAAMLFVGVTSLGQVNAEPQRVTWSLDARSERSARRVKRAVLWHLGEMAGDGADLSAAELIVNELVGNVARHTPGPAELTLEWNGEVATVRVSDRGVRFELPSSDRPVELLSECGRGLFLVHAMAGDLRVEWTGEGNRVSAVLPIELRYNGRNDARAVEHA